MVFYLKNLNVEYKKHTVIETSALREVCRESRTFFIGVCRNQKPFAGNPQYFRKYPFYTCPLVSRTVNDESTPLIYPIKKATPITFVAQTVSDANYLLSLSKAHSASIDYVYAPIHVLCLPVTQLSTLRRSVRSEDALTLLVRRRLDFLSGRKLTAVASFHASKTVRCV